MESVNLRNVDELLKGHLGNKTIINSKVTRLTAPGENFGSVMLGVDLRIKNSEGTEEDVHLVAKMLPDTEMFRKIFNIQVTFINELRFYDTIVPTLKEFQREQGVSEIIDCFAELYGARTSLNPNSTEVDDDAVLIIENLKISGT